MTTIQAKCFNCGIVFVVGENPQELPICHSVLTSCSRDSSGLLSPSNKPASIILSSKFNPHLVKARSLLFKKKKIRTRNCSGILIQIHFDSWCCWICLMYHLSTFFPGFINTMPGYWWNKDFVSASTLKVIEQTKSNLRSSLKFLLTSKKVFFFFWF